MILSILIQVWYSANAIVSIPKFEVKLGIPQTDWDFFDGSE